MAAVHGAVAHVTAEAVARHAGPLSPRPHPHSHKQPYSPAHPPAQPSIPWQPAWRAPVHPDAASRGAAPPAGRVPLHAPCQWLATVGSCVPAVLRLIISPRPKRWHPFHSFAGCVRCVNAECLACRCKASGLPGARRRSSAGEALAGLCQHGGYASQSGHCNVRVDTKVVIASNDAHFKCGHRCLATLTFPSKLSLQCLL